MTLRLWGLMVGSALSATLGFSAQADACGACFHGEIEGTVVTGHRMAVSISPVQSVLWDQIQYSGDPAEFAWVLPVKPGAYVDVATDAWFETLEAGTSVNVVGNPTPCPSSSGCGSSDGALGALSAENASGGVSVIHKGTVGPYETVTIETETPGALQAWLAQNHFILPPELAPTIDAYVAEGFQFIALRLAPSKGIAQMKPVRVVSPGASTTLPLRMVAGGTGANVPIVLYVITEGRFETVNFPALIVPRPLVSWDFVDEVSNYSELRDAVLGGGDRRGFITAYAQPQALLNQIFNPVMGVSFYAVGDRTATTMSELYFEQARQNGELHDDCSGLFFDLVESMKVVVNPCPAGFPLGSAECSFSGGGIDATTLACGSSETGLADDLAISLVGLHPADVWVTRLEANLPHSALSEDLVLGPSAKQEALSNWIEASVKLREESFCGSAFVAPSSGGSDKDGRRTGGMLGLGLAAASLLALGRRFGKARLTLVPLRRARSRG